MLVSEGKPEEGRFHRPDAALLGFLVILCGSNSCLLVLTGLGWIAIGCKGQADFRVSTFPGVAVTTHDSLVPDYAKEFERPGFSTLLPKAQGQPGKGASVAVKGGE